MYLPRATKNWQELPVADLRWQQRPGTSKSFQELPGATRSCQKRRKCLKLTKNNSILVIAYIIGNLERSRSSKCYVPCCILYNLEAVPHRVNNNSWLYVLILIQFFYQHQRSKVKVGHKDHILYYRNARSYKELPKAQEMPKANQNNSILVIAYIIGDLERSRSSNCYVPCCELWNLEADPHRVNNNSWLYVLLLIQVFYQTAKI